jgi:hypothetical protein
MRLLYTGAESNSADQKQPSNSLGGYVSRTIIQNDSSNSIFSNPSILAKQQLRRQTRLIAILNNDNQDYLFINLKFKLLSSSVFKYRFAVVLPSEDSEQSPVFESLSDEKALPYEAEFEDIVSETVYPLETLSLTPGKVFGLWLVREFDKTKLNTKKCDDFLKEDDGVKTIEETFDIEIVWSSESSISDSGSQS